MWTEKVKKHMPGSKKPRLIDASEEASKVLVVQLKIAMFRGLTKNRKEMVHIARGKMLELENHPCEDVEHRSEGGVHEGDGRTATLILFLAFGENVA